MLGHGSLGPRKGLVGLCVCYLFDCCIPVHENVLHEAVSGAEKEYGTNCSSFMFQIACKIPTQGCNTCSNLNERVGPDH